MGGFGKSAAGILGGGMGASTSKCAYCGYHSALCSCRTATTTGIANSSNQSLLQQYSALASQYSQYMTSGYAMSGAMPWSSQHTYTPPTKAELYKDQCRTALRGELTDEEFSKVTLEEYEKYVNLASEALGEFLSDGANAVRGWQTFRKVVEEMRRSVAQGGPTAELEAETAFHKLAQKERQDE